MVILSSVYLCLRFALLCRLECHVFEERNKEKRRKGKGKEHLSPKSLQHVDRTREESMPVRLIRALSTGRVCRNLHRNQTSEFEE